MAVLDTLTPVVTNRDLLTDMGYDTAHVLAVFVLGQPGFEIHKVWINEDPTNVNCNAPNGSEAIQTADGHLWVKTGTPGAFAGTWTAQA